MICGVLGLPGFDLSLGQCCSEIRFLAEPKEDCSGKGSRFPSPGKTDASSFLVSPHTCPGLSDSRLGETPVFP